MSSSAATSANSAAGPFCDKCFEVVKHDGNPEGKIEDLQGGHKVYVATPKPDKAVGGAAVVICTDIFGYSFINNQLIADSFADNGFLTYIPDYFNGDPIPADFKANPDKYPGFTMEGWRPNHGPQQTRPALDAALEALKQKGYTKLGLAGYCFGARYVVDLILEGNQAVKAGALAHPSQLKVPADLEALSKASVPIVWLTCERDGAFPAESQKQADEILGPLGESKYKRFYYADNDHGFAVRGDLSLPQVKKAKEDAFKQSVDWFTKHLA